MKDLFLLDPDVIFLNHGSFGACPRPVFEAYQRFQLELERRPVEFLAPERRFPDLIEPARHRLADHVGAPRDDLVFTTNATVALNAVVRSLDLHPGDEVLLGDAEYGGIELLWEFVARRTGATLTRVPFDELAPRPRTRAVFCSHVEWSTGRVNDVAAVARGRVRGRTLDRRRRACAGTARPGSRGLGADVYAGNCHKWLCAPKGAGFLYARPEVQPLIDPPVVSWDWAAARRSRSRTAGRGRATRRRSSPCRPRSTSRPSTTGRRYASAARRC